jgi:hypothetical protein
MTTLKKNRLFPLSYDEISLVDSGGGAAEDGSIAPDVLIMKRNTISPDQVLKLDPCSPKSSTGEEESKKSKRGKNWKEERHPRDEKGRMKKSSADSKSKHGKGGTTKSKLDAECRKNKSGVKKISKWDDEARLRSVMERKAAQ